MQEVNKPMLTVFIKTESHYTVNRQRVRSIIAKTLKEKGAKAPVEVSLAIVGDRMMRRMNKTYRQMDETTNVLSFPLATTDNKAHFVDPPSDILYLGDIVISYPQAREEAAQENKMVDDKIDELVEHGLLHLLGFHHD